MHHRDSGCRFLQRAAAEMGTARHGVECTDRRVQFNGVIHAETANFNWRG